jgi:ribosomal protein S18 acetylase RimI-like enzyme
VPSIRIKAIGHAEVDETIDRRHRPDQMSFPAYHRGAAAREGMAGNVLTFLHRHRLAVQASVSPAGAPQAAVVGYGVSDRLEIVFDTLDSTRKAQNLRGNSRIALTIGGLTAGDERTVQLEGIADEPAGLELEALKRVYYAAYPDGPTRLSWPGLIYIRVRPTWIRDSDYHGRPPEIIEFREAGRADVDAMADAHRDSIQSLGTSFYSSEEVLAWRESVRGELYLEAMDRDEVFFIATRGDEVLGFASDYPVDRDTHGASAYVRGRAARHGFGSTLLCLAQARARLRGARRVEIEASLTGVDFYRRHGFIETGRGDSLLTTGRTIACVFMRKDLSPP